MSLCYEVTGATSVTSCNAFTLLITRTNPDACLAAKAFSDPSLDATLSEWVREQRGPDGFMVMTDGAERIVSEWSTYNGAQSAVVAYTMDKILTFVGPFN